MRSATHVLAIDQGTTGTAVLVFDRDGRQVTRAHAEFAQHYPRPGWVEHDAEEIWRVTTDVIGEALTQAGLGAGDLAAIGITNQRETTVLWERATGRPVSRAVVWQDRRTAEWCDQLKAEGHEPVFRRKTGLLLDPYFSGTKLAWLLDHTEGARPRAEAGELAFGTVDSWLIWKLTGGRVHATDYSNASRTLLYNIHDLTWDPELLGILGVPAALLPEVLPSSWVYGETDPRGVFGARIPVAGVAGDQQAALFGQACHGEGLAKNTYGTGSFVLMNTGTSAVHSSENLLTTIAWGIGREPVEYALEGAIFVTGAAVQWLRDELQIIQHATDTEALACSLEGNDGVYFVPALVGLGAPDWDPYARGLLIGLTRGSGRAHLARAVLESIAYQTRDVVDTMARDSGLRLQELRADGGCSANGFLMQFQADLLGVPVAVPRIAETTALGAAYLAGLATGLWSSQAELDAKWQLEHQYQPRLPATERDALHRRWRQAVERSKGWAEAGG